MKKDGLVSWKFVLGLVIAIPVLLILYGLSSSIVNIFFPLDSSFDEFIDEIDSMPSKGFERFDYSFGGKESLVFFDEGVDLVRDVPIPSLQTTDISRPSKCDSELACICTCEIDVCSKCKSFKDITEFQIVGDYKFVYYGKISGKIELEITREGDLLEVYPAGLEDDIRKMFYLDLK